MPCYDPPLTRRDLRDSHEWEAKRKLKNIGIHNISGPAAVQHLCDWCTHATDAQIRKAEAHYWWRDHQKYDLQQSGLAKLTEAEKKALGLNDNHEA